ncbi:hypothetical protein L484_015549 [Morus notabilis]|uniref:Uncharacterized protein n=1 Tax=Morus notabilis TaxID=981085 RepID=W9SL71_9ROSA|nr:hypothetical protein L484_015549 [Morus notabilis]
MFAFLSQVMVTRRRLKLRNMLTKTSELRVQSVEGTTLPPRKKSQSSESRPAANFLARHNVYTRFPQSALAHKQVGLLNKEKPPSSSAFDAFDPKVDNSLLLVHIYPHKSGCPQVGEQTRVVDSDYPRTGIITTHLGHSILIRGWAATSRLRHYGNFLEEERKAVTSVSVDICYGDRASAS